MAKKFGAPSGAGGKRKDPRPSGGERGVSKGPAYGVYGGTSRSLAHGHFADVLADVQRFHASHPEAKQDYQDTVQRASRFVRTYGVEDWLALHVEPRSHLGRPRALGVQYGLGYQAREAAVKDAIRLLASGHDIRITQDGAGAVSIKVLGGA